MKSTTLFLLIVLFSAFSANLLAGDVSAEYKMTGIGDKITTSKMFFKNGDQRTEVSMNISGKEMNTVTLKLKSNPGVTLVFNSFSKTYSEVKNDAGNTKTDDLSVSVIGNEKVGAYNCKHVRMTSDKKSWDMWLTKDLPDFDFPIERNNEAVNRRIKEMLKSKSAEGVPVKMAFLKPGTEAASMTMELVKFESKDLDESLFKIPAGYVKSTTQIDAEKMKSMTPEERQEMVKKMMEENMPQNHK